MRQLRLFFSHRKPMGKFLQVIKKNFSFPPKKERTEPTRQERYKFCVFKRRAPAKSPRPPYNSSWIIWERYSRVATSVSQRILFICFLSVGLLFLRLFPFLHQRERELPLFSLFQPITLRVSNESHFKRGEKEKEIPFFLHSPLCDAGRTNGNEPAAWVEPGVRYEKVPKLLPPSLTPCWDAEESANYQRGPSCNNGPELLASKMADGGASGAPGFYSISNTF